MAAQKTDVHERGLAVRREVLGGDYVDASMQRATDFTRPLQDLVNDHCWGAVWTRPGLSRRDRSLLNLGMLTALGKTHELKLHVRGALNNGLTSEEISEALLQAGIYAGIPAAVEAFRAAGEVIDGAS
jgi:4-carboxymuconolactone decarboxylase